MFLQKLESGQFGFPVDFDSSWINEAVKQDMEKLGLPFSGEVGTSYDIRYTEAILDQVLVARNNVVEGLLPPVYAGILNKGTVQAEYQPIPMEEAGLILVDAGLVTFSYLIGKILYEATPIIIPSNRDEGDPRVSNNDSLIEGDEWIEATLSANQANLLLHDVIACTIDGNSRQSVRIPITKESTYFGASIFADSCLRFTIAHELGHVVSEVDNIPIEIDGQYEFSAEQRGEFKCDMFAIWCLISHYKQRMRDSKGMNERSYAMTEIVAPLIFFMFNHHLKVYQAISVGRRKIEYKEHPPDILRIKAMLFMLSRDGLLDELTPKIALFSQHATNFQNYLVERYKNKYDGEIALEVDFLDKKNA